MQMAWHVLPFFDMPFFVLFWQVDELIEIFRHAPDQKGKSMNLLEEIKNYQLLNPQEARDKEQMIWYITHHTNYLERENLTAFKRANTYNK